MPFRGGVAVDWISGVWLYNYTPGSVSWFDEIEFLPIPFSYPRAVRSRVIDQDAPHCGGGS